MIEIEQLKLSSGRKFPWIPFSVGLSIGVLVPNLNVWSIALLFRGIGFWFELILEVKSCLNILHLIWMGNKMQQCDLSFCDKDQGNIKKRKAKKSTLIKNLLIQYPPVTTCFSKIIFFIQKSQFLPLMHTVN